MANGGKRAGAGRKKGIPNRRTAEMVASVEKTGQTPLEYLTQVYRSPIPPEFAEKIEQGEIDINLIRSVSGWHAHRIDAAKAAAQYVHPKLQTTTLTGPDDGPIKFEKIERVIVDS